MFKSVYGISATAVQIDENRQYVANNSGSQLGKGAKILFPFSVLHFSVEYLTHCPQSLGSLRRFYSFARLFEGSCS